LWEFLNQKGVKKFLGVMPSVKFPIINDVYKVLNNDDSFRNYNSAEDWLWLIDRGYIVWYFTGEYDAYTPVNAFESMLNKLGWKGLKYTSIEKFGKYGN